MRPLLRVALAFAIPLLVIGCSSPGTEDFVTASESPVVASTPIAPEPTGLTPSETTGSEGEGSLASATSVGTEWAQPGSGGSPSAAVSVDDLIPPALAILDGVNDLRQENGLPPLEGDGILFSIAFARAQDMAERKYLGHFDPQGGAPLASVSMTQLGFEGKLAENVSAFSGRIEDAAFKTLEAWGGSPAFRTVMLDPVFRYSGVGLSWDGQWWKVAQVFAEVRPEGEPK